MSAGITVREKELGGWERKLAEMGLHIAKYQGHAN